MLGTKISLVLTCFLFYYIFIYPLQKNENLRDNNSPSQVSPPTRVSPPITKPPPEQETPIRQQNPSPTPQNETYKGVFKCMGNRYNLEIEMLGVTNPVPRDSTYPSRSLNAIARFSPADGRSSAEHSGSFYLSGFIQRIGGFVYLEATQWDKTPQVWNYPSIESLESFRFSGTFQGDEHSKRFTGNYNDIFGWAHFPISSTSNRCGELSLNRIN